ncbi:MAG: FecR domain-containing protein [Acidobacteriota bacterium]|nr:FecR domain-containing protein [Acidobacteriota bacterium]
MKRGLRTVSFRLFVLTCVALCTTIAVRGQVRESHFISARAGNVNYVSGDVTFRASGQTEWQTLTAKSILDSGDVVKAGAGGLAEVLLNPGSYLRVAENTEFELSDASLDNLRLKVIKGGAVIEATGFGDAKTLIAVNTPQTQVSIIKSGLYRINVLPSGVTEVAVRKGRAVIADNQAAPVKGDNKARVTGDYVEVAKFDKKKEADALDGWSKDRAKELAEANRKLSSRNVNALLSSVNPNSLWSSRSPRHGLWLYDSARSYYTFLPFYAGWSSPYGRSYYNSLGWNGYNDGGQSYANSGRMTMSSGQSSASGGGVSASPTMSSGNGGQSHPSAGGNSAGGVDSPRSMPVERESPRQPAGTRMRDPDEGSRRMRDQQ